MTKKGVLLLSLMNETSFGTLWKMTSSFSEHRKSTLASEIVVNREFADSVFSQSCDVCLESCDACSKSFDVSF